MKISQPAFPTWLETDNMAHGMSLRDYFAAAAMQGFLSTEYCRGIPHDFVAKEGFRVADAMLKAREA
jgi:hypothetical protein